MSDDNENNMNLPPHPSLQNLNNLIPNLLNSVLNIRIAPINNNNDNDILFNSLYADESKYKNVLADDIEFK